MSKRIRVKATEDDPKQRESDIKEEEEEEEDVAGLEVEYLLQSREFLGTEEFYVVWRGQPISKASWESKETLLEHHDCRLKIKGLKALEKSRHDALTRYKEQKKANELVKKEEKNLGCSSTREKKTIKTQTKSATKSSSIFERRGSDDSTKDSAYSESVFDE